MKVLHRQMYVRNAFGGVTNTTLCNRVRHGVEYNMADSDAEVTCSYCRAIMADPARYKRARDREVSP